MPSLEGSYLLKESEVCANLMPYIDPWSTVIYILINTRSMSPLILDWHLTWQLVDSWLFFTDTPLSADQYRYMKQSTVYPLSTNCCRIECRSSVNQHIDQGSMKCKPSISRDVVNRDADGVSIDWVLSKGLSRVSIDTQPRMTVAHLIHMEWGCKSWSLSWSSTV